MAWLQPTDPLRNLMASVLVAVLPVLVIFWALIIRKMRGWQAGILATAAAGLIAVAVYRMPLRLALLSTITGAAYGLFPICWIVLTAVFLFNITVRSGQFEVIRHFMAGITADRRIQALLIAFSFGSFLEGTAGFGAPVAITAAMLAALGFEPLYAAGLCLIANTAPVAFGSIGIPVTVMSQVTSLPEQAISQIVGRTLPFLSALLPFYIVVLMAGFKKAREVAPAALVSGLSFSLIQFVTANYLGPSLPDVLAGIGSIISLLLLLKFWQPRSTWHFPHEPAPPKLYPSMPGEVAFPETPNGAAHPPGPGSIPERAALRQQRANLDPGHTHSTGQTESPAPTPAPKATLLFGDRRLLWALSPFLALTLTIIIWGLPPVKSWLTASGTVQFPVPGLHNAIRESNGLPVAHIFRFNYLSAAGTAILIASILSLLFSGLTLKQGVVVFRETLRQLSFPILTIAIVLAFAYLVNDSGISQTIARGLASTGLFFPFFAPVLGWLGVFITGSDTSSNALFGRLQSATATSIGVDPLVTVGANLSGGVIGKMISPQSIAVAAAAGGLTGRESDLFRFTLRHSFILLSVICCMVLAQAYWLKWIIPVYIRPG
ncbi:MAG TPA: L-lactate permease [Puia sp.]|nr:L-lactate permease [Puia sp.]